MEQITLTHGNHSSPSDGMCAMEAAAFIAGEPHSDHPECVCPVYAAFLRGLNDARWSSDEVRTEAMMPLVRAVLNTRASKEVELERARRLARLALFKWTPKAGEAAIRMLDRVGVDTKAMRTAYKKLADSQTEGRLSHAAARAAAVANAAADYAAYAAADAARAAARAADAYDAAYAAYDAAYAAADAADAYDAAAAAARAARAARAAYAADADAARAADTVRYADAANDDDAFLRRVCEDFASILT